MTYVDAARLTLALLSGQPPSTVVEEFELLRSLEAKTPPPASGFTAGSGLDKAHCLEDALIWLFSLTSDTATIREHGRCVKNNWLWPYVTVSVDASVRAAQIWFSGQSCNYEDLARERELDELSKLPLTLERMEREQAVESRSAGWYSCAALARRMRVVRTIENEEIAELADAMAGSACLTGQD